MDPVIGDVVTVHGLQGRAELNGQIGTLVSFDSDKGRWQIQLEAEVVSIKPGTSEIENIPRRAPELAVDCTVDPCCLVSYDRS